MKPEPRWHAAIAVIVAVVLYERLPPKLTFGPIWIAPLLVALTLIPLLIFGGRIESRLHRAARIALTATLSFFNIASVVLLLNDLLNVRSLHHGLAAADLFRSGALIWCTNVIVFALWFWEIDDGGLSVRENAESCVAYREADFLFPQMTMLEAHQTGVAEGWRPMFLDYLYLSFTNALAFSPTDVMPLTRIAKILMLVESLISFATVALILARSVNILT